MRPKPQIIHEWTEPAKVRIHEAQQLRKRAKVVIPCILVITFVVEAILYLSITILIPQEIQEEMEFSWLKLFSISFLASVGIVVFFLGGTVCVARYSRGEYKITDKGIGASGRRNWNIPWHRVKSYSLSKHDFFPEVTSLTLLFRKHQMRVLLPEGEHSQQIIAAIANRVPLVQESQGSLEKPRLSKSQWFLISLFVLGYLALATAFPVCARNAPSPAVLVLVPIFGALRFGPGTLGFLIFFGRPCFKNKHFKSYAIAINLVTFFLIILLLFILGLYLVFREFPPSPQ